MNAFNTLRFLGQKSLEPESKKHVKRKRLCKVIRDAPLHGIWIDNKKYLPVDIDTTAMDNSKTKKEGVSRTYRGFDGYHPIIAYVGKEGYMLDSELRPGSQHCQKGTVDFLKE
jgi:hypothetical protein